MYVYAIGHSPQGLFRTNVKQLMINKYSNKHNQDKSLNWREADQLAIYKRNREVELGATENNISQRSKRDFNQRPTDFKSGALTIRLRCLLNCVGNPAQKQRMNQKKISRPANTICVEVNSSLKNLTKSAILIPISTSAFNFNGFYLCKSGINQL